MSYEGASPGTVLRGLVLAGGIPGEERPRQTQGQATSGGTTNRRTAQRQKGRVWWQAKPSEQMGAEEQESGFVRPSARTGRRQTRGEDKRTSQGKKRPHAEAYTGELIYSVMRARDSQIQEYVFKECASTLFLQS